MGDVAKRCPECSASLTGDRPFCAECGTRVRGNDTPSRLETRARSRAPATTSGETGRFLPGGLLAGRYRIVALLGRGGMGEVYRADDLKLGQPVALKFLPAEFERDPARLERLLAEVRLARQVSHPSVCRVYDVGEHEDQHFLSMEYVDGEDLASLLRRIGRLPEDKAVELARQICAGLAAAHEQGIIHRDLKPSNVMIDGRGRARITDFGLASLGDAVGDAEARSGTPAYMAPEQLAGREATARSDLYGLGLVLYEMVTGKAPFAGATTLEAALSRSASPATPSSHVSGLDPAVERIILRCLESEPAERPVSALAVAAALPGGDPLAAALAAGEIPSPELVAQAGQSGGLRPAFAAVGVGLVLVLSVVLVLVSKETLLAGRVPLDKPREVLTERAREIVRLAGYHEPPADSLQGFEANVDYLSHLERKGAAPDPWAALERAQPAALRFVYRQSPALLLRIHKGSIGDWFHDPPPTRPGMVEVRLDTVGRLLAFEAVPPRRDQALPSTDPPDWRTLVEAAGLDPGTLVPSEPRWLPRSYADRREAWTGAYPEDPGTPIRIEAASLQGRPVSFLIIEPWERVTAEQAAPASTWDKARELLSVGWLLVVLVGAAIMARRNLRLGHGDRRTAFRFAALLGILRMMWLLGAHHLPSSDEMNLFIGHLAWSLYRVGLVYVFYLALEPYARRLWPRMLASWVRLFDGRLRDPLVGRDLLAGVLYGTLAGGLEAVATWAPPHLGLPPYELERGLWSLEALRGTRHALAAIAGVITERTLFMLVGLMLFLLLRVVLRRTWPAVAVVSALSTLLFLPDSGSPWPYLAVVPVALVVFWGILFRLGLLPLLLGTVVNALLRAVPLTFDLNAWYGVPTLLALGLVLGLALWGFWTGLAGRRLFRDELLPADAA